MIEIPEVRIDPEDGTIAYRDPKHPYPGEWKVDGPHGVAWTTDEGVADWIQLVPR